MWALFEMWLCRPRNENKLKPMGFAAIAIAFIFGFSGFCYADVMVGADFARHIKGASSVTQVSSAEFGSSVSNSTGKLEFTNFDVNLPGSNDLPVRFGRRLDLGLRRTKMDLRGLGEWDVEVPYITGTVSTQWGWSIGPNNYSRCSSTSTPYVGNPAFTAYDFWAGYQIHIPGEHSGSLMINGSLLPDPTDGSIYPWVIGSKGKLACLSGTHNYPGEGFLLVQPDGKKYYFNYAVERQDSSPLRKGPAGEMLYVMYRKQVYMLATRIEDRFGNWVSYGYSGDKLVSISSSDGRAINVQYDSGGVTVSANARQWRYSIISGKLKSVHLPDGGVWQYESLGSFDLLEGADDGMDTGFFSPEYFCLNRNLNGGGYDISITHPSGATAKYELSSQEFSRQKVKYRCVVDYHVGDVGYAHVLEHPYFEALSLKKFTISGAGLTNLVTSYSYEVPEAWFCDLFDPTSGQFYGELCDGPVVGASSRWVTIANPDGSVRREKYGIIHGVNDGQLLSVEKLSGSGVVLEATNFEYISDADFPGQAFSARIGYPMIFDGMEHKLRPLRRTTKNIGGVTFSMHVNSYDQFANPVSVSKWSSLGYSKTDVTEYYHDTSKWVLGQIKRVYNVDTGIVMSRTEYHPTTALPYKVFAYEKLQQTLGYHANGTLHTSTDGRNNTTTFTNWKRGIPQNIQYADGTTQSALVNDNGWITAVTDENGYSTGYGYDAMGRLGGIVYPNEDNLTYYNKTIQFRPLTANDWRPPGVEVGQWRRYEEEGSRVHLTYYDALWRPVLVHHYDASNVGPTLQSTKTEYDAEGRVVFQSYPTGELIPSAGGVRTTYDPLGRVTHIKQDSEHGVLTTTTEYLPNFEVRTTNPRGYQVVNGYQVFDQPTYDNLAWSLQPEGKTVQIDRNLFGLPTALNQRNADSSKTVTRRYVYDANMQVCKTIEPETGVTVMDYDAAGNVAWTASGLSGGNYVDINDCANSRSAAYGSGRRISRSYDARNRVTFMATPDGRGTQSWVYTPDGLVSSSIVDNDGPSQSSVDQAYVYNKRRLLAGESMTQRGWYTWSLGYGYDSNGNLASSQYPDSMIVTYNPNALGQARHVVNAASGKVYATGVSYYPNGVISQFTYGNGIVHTMQQNARQLPSRSADAGVVNYAFSYDPNGNPNAIYDDLRGTGYSRWLEYDGLDRLTAAGSASFGGDHWHRFTYDALDNIKSWKLPGVKDYANYVYDASNRLTQIQNSAGGAVVNLQYDVQGNLANKNGQAYQFDYGNRLRTATAQETYRYDAEGRRVLQWSPSGGNILSIYSKSGQLMFTEDHRRSQSLAYLYLGGSQVARVRDFTSAPSVSTASISTPTSSNGSYTVTWTGNDLAETYKLEQSVDGGAWVSVYEGPNKTWSASGKGAAGYRYRVTACNSKGCSSVSNVVTVNVIGAPAAPAINAPGQSTNGAIGVGWSTVSTANRYELEESANGGGWTTIYNGANTNHPISGKQPGSYAYRVRACNDAGCGGYSATATTQVIFPPTSAPSLSAPGFVTNGAYTASWSGVTHATSYQLEESVNGGGWTLVYNSGGTSAGFSGKATATYSYRVRACNAAGCSGYSATQSVQVQYAPAGAPAISAPGLSNDGTYGVGWNTLSGADRYELEESANGGGWTLVHNGSANGYSAVGKPDGSYGYRARGCNAAGCSGYSPTVTTQVTHPPAVPASISAPASSAGSHTISWAGVGNASSYQLEESVNGGGWTLIYNANGTAASVSGRGQGSYAYRVRACNAGGCSGYTGNANVSIVMLPAVPTGLAGNSEPYTSTKYLYDIWWNAVPGATYYQVQAGSAIKNNGASRSYHTQGGNSMSFRVQACNSAGCSAWTSTLYL